MIVSCRANLQTLDQNIQVVKNASVIFGCFLFFLIIAIVLVILQKNAILYNNLLDVTTKIPYADFLGDVNIYILCFSIVTFFALIYLLIQGFKAVKIYLTLDSLIATLNAKIQHVLRMCKQVLRFLDFFESMEDDEITELKLLIHKIQIFCQKERILIENLKKKDKTLLNEALDSIHYHYNWLLLLQKLRDGYGVDSMFAPEAYSVYFQGVENYEKQETNNENLVWLLNYLEQNITSSNQKQLMYDFNKLYAIWGENRKNRKNALLLDIHCRLSTLFRLLVFDRHAKKFPNGKAFVKRSKTDQNFIKIILQQPLNSTEKTNLRSYI
jgi:hypothetical protein